MNEQLFTLILSIAGAIILLLLAAIGYGVREFVQSAKGMQQAVNQLQQWFSGQNTDLSWIKNNCTAITEETKDKLTHHDLRLEGHDNLLREHGEKIAIISERKPRARKA